MIKTVNTIDADPLAAIRKVFLDNIDAVSAGHARAAKVAEAEFAKAKEVASTQAEEAQAAVATGEIATAGAEKIRSLVQKESVRLSGNNAVVFKELINAKNPQDIFAIQKAYFDAEQIKAKAFFEAFTKLTGSVANEALKPVWRGSSKT